MYPQHYVHWGRELVSTSSNLLPVNRVYLKWSSPMGLYSRAPTSLNYIMNTLGMRL